MVDTSPFCKVEEADSFITVTYEFNHVNLLYDSIFPNTVVTRINGFGFNHVLGQPEVPMRWDAIRLPKCKSWQVGVIDSSFIDIPIELAPARRISICDDIDLSTKNVLPIKPYSGFFPSNIIPSAEHLYYRSIPILHLCICPVKYNYSTKTTRLYSRLKYRISLAESKEKVNITSKVKNRIASQIIDNIAINHNSDNRDFLQGSIITEDYLIITTEEYRLPVERLAEWKRMLGFRVTVLYQNGWSPENVKSYIQDFESLHSNLNYVLVVGGLNDVNSFSYSYNNTNYVSDYEYSCLDGDNFPDIYRGRLLVSNVDEAETVVDKIINYERNPVKINSLYTTGINGAVFEADGSGNERTRAVLTSELIRKVLVDSLQKNLNFVYLRGGGAYPTHWNNSYYSFGNELPDSILHNITWDGSAQQMMDYINRGAFYTFFIGHGAWDKWHSLALTKDSLDKLNNSNQYPVVFSMSCSTGDFSHDDCFAQHFCSMSKKGSVAVFAATASAPFGSTEILGMDMIDAIWPNSLLNPLFPNGVNSVISTQLPSYQLGQILNQGIYKMRMTWDYYDLYTSRIFHCFGDPSMRIYTEEPSSFNNLSIVRSGNSISVNTGDNNAEISFYNKTSGEIIRYKGTEYTYCHGADDVSVSVTGPNKIPYIDCIYLQNEEISGPVEYNGGTIAIGCSVTNEKGYGNVCFRNGDITIKGDNVTFDAGTTIELGTVLKVEK